MPFPSFAFAAPQNGADGKNINGGTWENGGTFTGGTGEEWTVIDEVAGSGGSGVDAENVSVVNKAGSTIMGGQGGDYSGNYGPGPSVMTGHGGIGVVFRNIGTASYSLINYGEIRGGDSGSDGNSGTTSAKGAVGVHITGNGNVLVNYGAIYGGTSLVRGTHTIPDQAVMITGDRNHIINAGIIQSGHNSSIANRHYAAAILITGNDNIVELRGDYFLNQGSGSSSCAVALLGSVGNTLALGGDITEGRVFDQADIAKFSRFDTLAKFGESNWTLTGTTSATQLWNVYGGTLMVDSATTISGSNVYQGLLDFIDPATSNLGAVEVFGPGTYAAPGGKTGYYSGGALPLGRGGVATSVTLHAGATAHAYSDDTYLDASGAITVEDGLKFYLRSNDWVTGQEYKMLQGATASIDSAYQGDGKYYSLAGYDFRAFQSGADALHIQMLRLKNVSENPDLTYNQESTGERVDSLPDGTPIKDIVEHVETGKLPDVLDQLSGEIYATLPTVLRNHDTRLRNNMLSSISRNALASMLCKTPQGDDPCQKKDDVTGKLLRTRRAERNARPIPPARRTIFG